MNPETITTAYLVKVNYPGQPNRNKCYTFRDADLLAARQAAFQKAQQVVAEKQAHEVLDVTVELVEIDRASTMEPTIISQVFQQRFHRAMFPDNNQLQGLDAFTKKSLPQSIFLTLNLEENESCNSPKAVWDSLAGLTCEQEYYRSFGHSMGFGSTELTLSGPHKPAPKDLSTLSDEELNELLEQLQKPAATFYLLYDGLAHGISLISQYNQCYAHPNGTLNFTTKFLSQH